jgi:hypothetical protein
VATSSILILLLAAGGSYQEPAKDSARTTFTPREGDFRVDFPAGRIMEQGRPIPSAVGTIEQRTYYTRSGDCLFTVQRFRYPRPFPVLQVTGHLNAQKRGILQGNVELIRENDVTVDNVTGQQFEYKSASPRADGTVSSLTRHFIKGSTYYVMTVMSEPNQELPRQADRFLDSFHFTNADRAPADATSKVGATPKLGVGAMGKAPAGGGPPRYPDATPEEALRTFMVAGARQDEAALRAVSLPDPELARLVQGEPAPPEIVERIRAHAAEMKIRRLQPGDKIKLPPNQDTVVGPDDVGEDRAMLLPEAARFPVRLRKIQGHWKVDAGPIIAARKAAEAARQKGRGQ